MSAKMATNQLKISKEIDLDSFQGIETSIWKKFYIKKVRFFVATLTDCNQNRYLNLYMAALCPGRH